MKKLKFMLPENYSKVKALVLNCLLFFFINAPLHAQDSITFTFYGKVVDNVQNSAIPFPEVEIMFFSDSIKTLIKGDSLGKYSITKTLLKGEQYFSISVNEQYYLIYQRTIEPILTMDCSMEEIIRLMPMKICYDSFLPTPIHFEEDETSLSEAWTGIISRFAKDDVYEGTISEGNYKVQVIAYCSYAESRRVARKRGKNVYNLLIDNGFPANSLELKIEGHKHFFYSEFKDGCHYFFQHGTGINITRKLFDEAEPDSRAYYQEWRQVVELEWVK